MLGNSVEMENVPRDADSKMMRMNALEMTRADPWDATLRAEPAFLKSCVVMRRIHVR